MFNDESGQVYFASSSRVQRSWDRNWMELSELDAARFEAAIGFRGSKETLLRAEAFAAYVERNHTSRPATGARRLADVAVTVTVHNIRELEPWMLEEVNPVSVLRAIWREVSRKCLTNFVTWQAFSKLILRKLDPDTGKIPPYSNGMATLDLFRHESQIRSPVLPLLDYITPLISPSFDFITILSINQNFPLQELIHLKKLKNLGVLHLMYTAVDETSYFNDRLLRAWSAAVLTEGAFPVLRILNIWGNSDITFRSLEHISIFPALAFFDVRQCLNFGTPDDVQLQARKLGWSYKIVTEASTDDHARLLAAWRARYGCNLPGGERKVERYYTERKKWDESRVMTSPKQGPQSTGPKDEAALLSFQEHASRVKAHENVWLYMGRKVDEDWRLNLHPLFSLIGQMTNDSDLEKAGVSFDPSQSLYALDWPIPPIPTASLHLGGEASSPPYPTTHRPDMMFSRLSQTQGSEAIRMSTPTKNGSSASNAEERHTSAEPRSRPEPKTVRPSKRMRFDAVLGSFLY